MISDSHQVVALLPMKEYSERIPNKNMRLFAGKPLYQVIIQILLNSRYVEYVAVNTDSKIIAESILKDFDRVKIVWRPPELQGDLVPMNKIIEYDLSQFQHEHFLQTHSTNPLLTKETLEKAIKQYFDNLESFDSLFSVTKNQSRFYWSSGEALNHNPEYLIRTQDLEPIYEENSNIYIFSKNSFHIAGNKRIGKLPQMFIMNKLEAIDIDDEDDFVLAENLYMRHPCH